MCALPGTVQDSSFQFLSLAQSLAKSMHWLSPGTAWLFSQHEFNGVTVFQTHLRVLLLAGRVIRESWNGRSWKAQLLFTPSPLSKAVSKTSQTGGNWSYLGDMQRYQWSNNFFEVTFSLSLNKWLKCSHVELHFCPFLGSIINKLYSLACGIKMWGINVIKGYVYLNLTLENWRYEVWDWRYVYILNLQNFFF